MPQEQRFEILLAREAEKALRRLPRGLLQHVEQAIDDLSANPRPPGCKKLVGHRDLYRVRVRDWRIIYAIEDDRLIVLIVKIAPRGAAYRDL